MIKKKAFVGLIAIMFVFTLVACKETKVDSDRTQTTQATTMSTETEKETFKIEKADAEKLAEEFLKLYTSLESEKAAYYYAYNTEREVGKIVASWEEEFAIMKDMNTTCTYSMNLDESKLFDKEDINGFYEDYRESEGLFVKKDSLSAMVHIPVTIDAVCEIDGEEIVSRMNYHIYMGFIDGQWKVVYFVQV